MKAVAISTSMSATPSAPETSSPVSSTNTRSRRHVIQVACVTCRKKRTRCDGRNPCQKCLDLNTDCHYEARSSVSKDSLRAEIRAAKAENASWKGALQALLLDSHDVVVSRLRFGESIDSIVQNLREAGLKSEVEPRKPLPTEEGRLVGSSGGPSHTAPDMEARRPSAGLREQFLSGQIAPIYVAKTGTGLSGGGPTTTRTKWIRTPMGSVSPTLVPGQVRATIPRRHSFDEDVHEIYPRPALNSLWTRVAPNKAVVDHLVQTFFTWEFPLFTLVSQEFFLRDFQLGAREFCSPALVNAIASLGTTYLQPDEATSRAEFELLGDTFFREAMGLLVQESKVSGLTSIQALGILAMRELSCGRELEAAELCLQAIRLLSSLDLEDLAGRSGHLQDHLTVRSITYRGLSTLVHAIRLITDQLSPSSNYHHSRLPLVSEPSAPEMEAVSVELHKRMAQLPDHCSTQYPTTYSQTLSNFVCGLTEYVYNFLERTRKRGKGEAKKHLAGVFQKCLLLYEAVLPLMRGEVNTSPGSIFLHTYFQFCLLALCRPFADYDMKIGPGGVSPRTICVEAIQSILDLTETYTKLFTLRQTPCFIPYFVFAAGLTRIIFSVDSTTLNPEPPASWGADSSRRTTTSEGSMFPPGTANREMGGCDVDMGNSPVSPTVGDSSMLSSDSESDDGMGQAVRQLGAMSVGHLAASQAAWVLRDFKPDHKPGRKPVAQEV